MRILILGSEGMLGREVLHQLSTNKKFEIYATVRGDAYLDKVDQTFFTPVIKFNVSTSAEIMSLLNNITPDLVINCIGVIKQHGSTISEHKYFFLNSILPRIVDAWCAANDKRLLHFSTDCVFTGSKGDYSPDDTPNAFDIYGLSKYLGEVSSKNSLTIRTSIIGFERASSRGLLSWFLSHGKGSSVDGYVNVMYSGVTTSFLASIIHKHIITSNHSGLMQLGGPKISKYDLLILVNKMFDANISINKCNKIKHDKSFCSKFAYETLDIYQPSWKDMLLHLKDNSLERKTLGVLDGKF